MVCHIKTIVKKAISNGYAIGAFNVHNLEAILGVVRAAQRAKSPAIIQVSEGAIKYIGLNNFVNITTDAVKNIAPRIPIAFNLDHGKNFEVVSDCLEAGFSSVHMDGSFLPLNENIKVTNEAMKEAKKYGAWVQGEVGPIMGGHGKIGGKLKSVPIADLNEVVEFVKKTNVDTLAAAVGTAHGVFCNETILMQLLRDIKQKTKKPFVLHGGSGVDIFKIKKSIKEGVNIINIGTDIKVAFSETLKKTCKENKHETDPRNLLRPTIEAVEKVVLQSMKIFGSVNQVKF
ncbi:class II fructose-bisphosphate aldolase family protein [Candidatus Parcubacteria bacterium]|nr:class II fructose-bisphosphate aldolase family protein [Candidatus Parcubacteria bacterium]